MKHISDDHLSEELNNLGRELAGAIEARAVRENGPPPDPNDLAALLEGNLEGEERDRVIEQALASPAGLSMLKAGLPEEEETTPSMGRVVRPSIFQRLKITPALATLAAALILAFVMFYNPQSSGNKTAIPFDSELREMVLNADSWNTAQDLATWRSAFAKYDVDLDGAKLKQVVMEDEYFTAKGLGNKVEEEEVIFRYEDGVLYIKVRKKAKEPDQEP